MLVSNVVSELIQEATPEMTSVQLNAGVIPTWCKVKFFPCCVLMIVGGYMSMFIPEIVADAVFPSLSSAIPVTC